MRNVKVSVIVPFYGVEKYIKKCLDSLVNQTLKDIEIIMVNDETPDNSQKIVDKYVKKYKNVVCYKKKNGGLGSARNYGLKKATGKYVMFIDSDDYIDKTMCEKLYNQAEENNDDIVICGMKEVDENYELLNNYSCYMYSDHSNKIMNLMLGHQSACNKLFRTKYLLENNYSFREKVWYEDIDFSVKACFNTQNVSFLDENLYYYLIRNGSIMNNKSLDRNIELLWSFDEILKYFKNKNKDEIEFITIYHMFMSASGRLLKNYKVRDAKKIVNKYYEYVKNNFPNFRKNKYLKYFSKKRKLLFNLMYFKLYLFVRLLYLVK